MTTFGFSKFGNEDAEPPRIMATKLRAVNSVDSLARSPQLSSFFVRG